MGFVGRPDGEKGSRFSQQRTGLGPVGPWDCPSCGIKNEGRKPEQGCAHCGAADPTKSKSGGTVTGARSQTAGTSLEGRPGKPALTETHRSAGNPEQSDRAPVRASDPLRIYRLIEYVITNPRAGNEVLRRSLVGSLNFDWGQLTGTIVDSLDARQEDLLQLARRQPGVWLGNGAVTIMMERGFTAPGDPPVVVPALERRAPDALTKATLTPEEAAEIDRYLHARKPMPHEIPDVGPIPTEEEHALAGALLDLMKRITGGDGLKEIHTFAIALGNVATELEGNSEPLKFMQADQCSRVANALMSLIPSDWEPQEPEAPPETDL